MFKEKHARKNKKEGEEEIYPENGEKCKRSSGKASVDERWGRRLGTSISTGGRTLGKRGQKRPTGRSWKAAQPVSLLIPGEA